MNRCSAWDCSRCHKSFAAHSDSSGASAHLGAWCPIVRMPCGIYSSFAISLRERLACCSRTWGPGCVALWLLSDRHPFLGLAWTVFILLVLLVLHRQALFV